MGWLASSRLGSDGRLAAHVLANRLGPFCACANGRPQYRQYVCLSLSRASRLSLDVPCLRWLALEVISTCRKEEEIEGLGLAASG